MEEQILQTDSTIFYDKDGKKTFEVKNKTEEPRSPLSKKYLLFPDNILCIEDIVDIKKVDNKIIISLIRNNIEKNIEITCNNISNTWDHLCKIFTYGV